MPKLADLIERVMASRVEGIPPHFVELGDAGALPLVVEPDASNALAAHV